MHVYGRKFLLTNPWLFGPLRTLVSFTTDARFSCYLPFTFISSVSALIKYSLQLPDISVWVFPLLFYLLTYFRKSYKRSFYWKKFVLPTSVFCDWMPKSCLYASPDLYVCFRDLLTPSVSMIPALSCKFVACLDPYVYAISHPRYR